MGESSKKTERKKCFLITPIDQPNSETRYRVDQWMRLIYEPALSENFEIIRADGIAQPGQITDQIIDFIVNADLAIIDYTGWNPNVMYEAAIRHLIEKPFIEIAPLRDKTPIPFDIRHLRCIRYDPLKLDYYLDLCEELKKYIKLVTAKKYKSPEILRQKFDFNKIISDPEQFIRILKKHIFPDEASSISGVVQFPDLYQPYPAGRSLYIGPSFYSNYLQKPINCPNCESEKIAKKEIKSYSILETVGMKLYKCENCGQEF